MLVLMDDVRKSITYFLAHNNHSSFTVLLLLIDISTCRSFARDPKGLGGKLQKEKTYTHTHRTRNITSHLRVATCAARTHIIPRMFKRLAPGTGVPSPCTQAYRKTESFWGFSLKSLPHPALSPLIDRSEKGSGWANRSHYTIALCVRCKFTKHLHSGNAKKEEGAGLEIGKTDRHEHNVQKPTRY